MPYNYCTQTHDVETRRHLVYLAETVSRKSTGKLVQIRAFEAPGTPCKGGDSEEHPPESTCPSTASSHAANTNSHRISKISSVKVVRISYRLTASQQEPITAELTDIRLCCAAARDSGNTQTPARKTGRFITGIFCQTLSKLLFRASSAIVLFQICNSSHL